MNLYQKMNVFLANQTVMYMKVHNLHWYVKGHQFFSLHEKFEEIYDQTADIIDDVAERILSVNKYPVANLKEVLELSTISERYDKDVSGILAVEILLADIEQLIKDSKELADLAEEADDSVTNDMFIGYTGEYQKLHWMLTSYLK